MIPICITSIAAGTLLAQLAGSRRGRVAALLAYAAAAGALCAFALQVALGVLTGPWLANASLLALACLAIAAPTAGLVARWGWPGQVPAC